MHDFNGIDNVLYQKRTTMLALIKNNAVHVYAVQHRTSLCNNYIQSVFASCSIFHNLTVEAHIRINVIEHKGTLL